MSESIARTGTSRRRVEAIGFHRVRDKTRQLLTAEEEVTPPGEARFSGRREKGGVETKEARGGGVGRIKKRLPVRDIAMVLASHWKRDDDEGVK